jgi:hypothetical protein
MEKKEKAARKLIIRKELLRDLKPAELIPVAGGCSTATSRGSTDASMCCCATTDTTGTCP